MARDRSGDIADVYHDLNLLGRAAMRLGPMSAENIMITTDLNELGSNYEASAKIPQEDFKTVMLSLNEQIGPSITTINSKISELVSWLNDYLQELLAEQARWEEEQRQAQQRAEEQREGQQSG